MTPSQYDFLIRKYPEYQNIFAHIYCFCVNSKAGIQTRKLLEYCYDHKNYSIEDYSIADEQKIANIATCLELLVKEKLYKKVYAIEESVEINNYKKYSLLRTIDWGMIPAPTYIIMTFNHKEETIGHTYMNPDRKAVIYFIPS